jgi:hypothetical protein
LVIERQFPPVFENDDRLRHEHWLRHGTMPEALPSLSTNSSDDWLTIFIHTGYCNPVRPVRSPVPFL